jgi:heat shock protein HslJ
MPKSSRHAFLRNLVVGAGLCMTLAAHAGANQSFVLPRFDLIDWPEHTIPSGTHGETISITFGINSDHKVEGFSGCNRFFGTYNKNEGGPTERLTLNPLASTRIACSAPLMAFESSFLGALDKVTSYRTSSSLLQLYTSDGQKLSFFANTDADRPIKVKYIEVAPQKVACQGEIPMQCLQVRANKDQPWVKWFGNIDGFEFVPGTAYTLRVAEESIPNPPAGGFSFKWILLQTLEAKRTEKPAPLTIKPAPLTVPPAALTVPPVPLAGTP